MSEIKIIKAREGNLKNVSVDIPKNKLVVFTGLSGSGKSTLLLDVLFNECQRLYLEAITLQGIRKPKVERIRGASPAIAITQTNANTNPRSTVGTLTDVYTDLRMIYEKLGVRKCPYCKETISSADCREETEKIGSDFYVYMYCCKCGQQMDKHTRTHFSFNTKEGACPACQGLGKIHSIIEEKAVDETLSLEEGAVRYWEKQYGKYQISVLYSAYQHYGLPLPRNLPINQFSKLQKAILFNGVTNPEVTSLCPDIIPPKNVSGGRFEGVYPILWRRMADKEGNSKQLEEYFDIVECLQCHGERLSPLSRSVTVKGTRLPELAQYSLEKLAVWIEDLAASLSEQHLSLVNDYLLDIRTKLNRFLHVGLGYLSLDRQVITLSGGELQKSRLAAVLDSELTGVIYILDEPTAGLHPRDTAGLITILKKLRDLGNSVLVIEHDQDIMAAADYIIDMGPGSGKHGGQIIAQGTLTEIMNQKDSITGCWLKSPHPAKASYRKPAGFIHIRNAHQYNLKHIHADIPLGCITAVTGPSGSGKSTLIFEVLAKGGCGGKTGTVEGLEQFHSLVEIQQSSITRMKRSNVATYTDVYSEIRSVFAKTNAAKAAGLTPKHFSFNTPGGRCENCQGLGVVDNNMLFFTDNQIVCPVCGGNRFDEKVLGVKYQGLSIKDVLSLSVDDAADFFKGIKKITGILELLKDVGLGYLELGQTLTTLSGGEGQRLKLARELINHNLEKRTLYLLDEPTTGLHPKDIEHFLVLLNRLADAGNTVVVVEHNQQLISHCDWIIDLGPEGGEKGGELVFCGTKEQFAAR